MTADISQVTIRLKVRWWVKPFMWTYACACFVFEWKPNVDRVAKLICDYGLKVDRG